MPLNQSNFGELLKSMSAAYSGGQEQAKAAQQAQQETTLAKLKSYLSGESAKQQADLDVSTLQHMKDTGLAEPGGGAKYGNAAYQSDPYAKNAGLAATQAGKFGHELDKAATPIEQSIAASRDTLDNLDLHSTTGDGAAFINEAKVLGGTTRGIGQLMAVLKPERQSLINQWGGLQNYANSGTMSRLSDDERKAMYGLVQARTAHNADLASDGASHLSALGAQIAPLADTNGLLQNRLGSINKNIASITSRKYVPAINADGSPDTQQGSGTLATRLHDKVAQAPSALRNFFSQLTSGGSSNAAPQAPGQQAPQQPPQFDFDAEDRRRAASKVQQNAQAPQNNQGQ